jgi:hypothetical protein
LREKQEKKKSNQKEGLTNPDQCGWAASTGRTLEKRRTKSNQKEIDRERQVMRLNGKTGI